MEEFASKIVQILELIFFFGLSITREGKYSSIKKKKKKVIECIIKGRKEGRKKAKKKKSPVSAQRKAKLANFNKFNLTLFRREKFLRELTNLL